MSASGWMRGPSPKSERIRPSFGLRRTPAVRLDELRCASLRTPLAPERLLNTCELAPNSDFPAARESALIGLDNQGVTGSSPVGTTSRRPCLSTGRGFGWQASLPASVEAGTGSKHRGRGRRLPAIARAKRGRRRARDSRRRDPAPRRVGRRMPNPTHSPSDRCISGSRQSRQRYRHASKVVCRPAE